MKYAYYPGCSLHTVATEYDQSTKAVCETLGIELEEIPDWTCCGASSAHSTDHLLGLAIPARDLALAEKMGHDVVAPCAACFQRLKFAEYEIKNNPKNKELISKAIEMDIQGTVQVFNTVDAIAAIGMDKIAEKVKKPLTGLKVACYYGCYLVKPPKICHVDDPENPHLMDDMMEAVGAKAVQWPYKTECCGGSLVFSNVDLCLKLSKDIIEYAMAAGADCIVSACPLCQPNLDMRQGQINKKFGTKINIPVFYFTELMGLAFGHKVNDLGLRKHFVDVEPALKIAGF